MSTPPSYKKNKKQFTQSLGSAPKYEVAVAFRVLATSGHKDHDVELRDWVVDLGHSAHQGENATKRQLLLRLWFPGMDRAV